MFIKYYCVSEVFLYTYELDFIPEHKYQIHIRQTTSRCILIHVAVLVVVSIISIVCSAVLHTVLLVSAEQRDRILGILLVCNIITITSVGTLYAQIYNLFSIDNSIPVELINY